MKSAMIALILSCLASVTAFADDLALQPDAPTRYTVVKGDTLWGISGRFLKDPWKWPKIWGMNREEIKNPHWIYPGDVIVLELVNGQPHLTVQTGGGDMPTVRLSPEIRGSEMKNAGILPIPASVINAFATQPRVIDENSLAKAPVIIDYRDGHIVVGAGDEVWAAGQGGDTENWDVVEPGSPIVDPDTKEVLGYSARVLGNGHTAQAGNPMKIVLDNTTSEVELGNRLIPKDNNVRINYVPHEPDHPVQGKILDTVAIMSEAGNYNTVLINKGRRDGMEPGTVLAIYRPGMPARTERGMKNMDFAMEPDSRDSMYSDANAAMTDDSTDLKTNPGKPYPLPEPKTGKVDIPSVRIGVCMVYRVFDKVSYAIIMKTDRTVMNGYTVQNP